MTVESQPAESIPAGDKASDAKPRGTFRAFRDPNYRLYWAGTLTSSSGQWMEIIIANWLMLELSGSPLLLGVLNFVRAVPMLLLGILGGTLADRIDRKSILIWTQALLLAIYGGLAILAFLGQLEPWHLLAASAGSGISWSFNQPARQSIVSDIVAREELMNAIALSSAGFQGSRMFGPMIAGLMLAAFGAVGALFALTVNYLLTMFWAWRLVVPKMERQADAPLSAMFGEAREGLRYVRSTPAVLGVMLIAMLPSALGQSYTTLFPIFARDVYGVDATAFGVLMAAPGIGALITALTMARLAGRVRRGPVISGAAIGFSVTLLVFSFLTNVVVVFVVLMIVGLFSLAMLMVSNTVIQTIVPRNLRGRVMGVWSLNRGVVPFGALLAGALADPLGAPTAMAIMAGIALASALVVVAKFKAAREIF